MPGAIQVEAGSTLTVFSDEIGRHHLWDLPELTFRAGLNDRIEVFAVATGLWIDSVRDQGASIKTIGGSDVQLNAKFGLLTEDRHALTLSAAAGLSLPVGSAAFSSGSYDPSLRLLWAKGLPRDWSLSGNVDFSESTAKSDWRSAGGISVGAGHPMTRASSWFVELFGNVSSGDPSQWRMDGGFAVVPSSNLQIDVSAGKALAGGPSAWFVAAGISARRLP
jgi:hypothetical protein